MRSRMRKTRPEAHRLRRPPLIAIVVVVGRRRAPLSVGRIAPGSRIQHQVLGRIDAVAVQILQEQRNAWDAIVERAAEQQRGQVVGGRRRKNRQAAAYSSAPIPMAQSRTTWETILFAPSAGTR